MKPTYYILISLFFVAGLNAQTPDFAWARHIQGNGATSITLDNDGNSFITGSYNGSSITLGTISLPYIGPGGNQYIAKFDRNGVALWAKRFTGVAVFDDINTDKLVADQAGNIYFSSVFYTGATMEGTALPVPTPQQGRDYFIAKFDGSGNFQWIKTAKLPNSIYNKTYNAAHLNSEGNICMTGLFNTSITFDNNHTLTNTVNTSGVDAFMAVYNPDGNIVETIHLGIVNPSFSTSYPDEIFKLDDEDNIYRLVPAINKIVKYDPEGNELMTKQITATGANLTLTSMASDIYGNIFLGGGFYNGTLVLEGTSLPSFGSSNNMDALLLKLDTSGNMQWVKQFQATVSDSYVQVRTDAIGNVYAVGQHSDPGEVRSLLIKYSNSGDLLWQKVIIPGPGTPTGWARAHNIVQSQNGGNIWVLGTFKERIFFETGTSFTSPGVFNVFLAQYGVCDTPVPSVTATGPTTFCAGDSVLLTASSATNYLWNTGDITQSIYVSQTGSYYVSAIEGPECYNNSAKTQVVSAPFPANAVTLAGYTLSAVESNASYQWINCANQLPVSGATAQNFSPEENGSYAVKITNSAGCTIESACLSVAGLGFDENTLQNNITLYPNPVGDQLNLSAPDVKIESVSIVNLIGQKIAHQIDSQQINTATFPAGTYLVTVQTEKGTWRGKFVKK